MILERVYFGAWLPRTMVHLEEVYDFLKFGRGSHDLSRVKVKQLHEALNATRVTFVDNDDYNVVTAQCGDIRIVISEDGVIMLDMPAHDVTKDTAAIEQFYAQQLGPALAYLFSRGAPLPVSLAHVEEIYPRIIVGRDISASNIEALLATVYDTLLVTRRSHGYTVSFGHISEIIDVSEVESSKLVVEDLVIYTIFIRGYSQLLTQYLEMHRTIWADITRVRESATIRHKDFTKLRMHILDTLATISFVQARMNQMGSILHARDRITPPKVQELLHTLGFSRYETLEATLEYTKDLWQMTADYVNDTMSLLESVLQENSQRELRILQLTTIAGVMVGFFGMNISFPWNDDWQLLSSSSWTVVLVVIGGVAAFYGFIRIMILNRRFVINRRDLKK